MKKHKSYGLLMLLAFFSSGLAKSVCVSISLPVENDRNPNVVLNIVRIIVVLSVTAPRIQTALIYELQKGSV